MDISSILKLADLGLSVILAVALIYVIQIGKDLVKGTAEQTVHAQDADKKQIELEKSLVVLASEAITENRLTRNAYEGNTQVLAKNSLVLEQVTAALQSLVQMVQEQVIKIIVETRTSVDDIRQQLTSNKQLLEHLSQIAYITDAPIEITITTETNEILSKFTVEPVIVDQKIISMRVIMRETKKDDSSTDNLVVI